MKSSSYRLATSAALFIFGLLSFPAHGQDSSVTVSEAGVFSYVAPKDWKLTSTPGSKYKVSIGDPQNNSFIPNINVQTDVRDASLSLADYIETAKANLKKMSGLSDLTIGDPTPFKTTNGLTGFRMVVTETVSNMNLEQVFFYFDGQTPGIKMVITCSSLAAFADKLVPAFDESMKTFSNK